MLYINEDTIKSNCFNLETFNRGKHYFKHDHVTNLRFFEEDLAFGALVSGSYRYSVQIELDGDYQLKAVHCDCPAFHRYEGFCKHIVAVILRINSQYAGVDFKQEKTKRVLADMLKLADYYSYKSGQRKTLLLEPTIIFRKSFNGYFASISLKLGEQKPYVVKNISSFFAAEERNEPLQFGKNFVYDPQIHFFSTTDAAIMNAIKEIYEMDKLLQNQGHSTGLIRGKEVILSPAILSKIFATLKDKPFTLELFGRQYEDTTVLEDELPLTFSLAKKETSLFLDMHLEGHLTPLTADGRYFFYQEKVYHITEKQEQHLAPFLYGANKIGTSLEIPEEYHESFVAKLMPTLKNAGKVTVDEAIEEAVYQKPLQTEIYLDEDKNILTVDIKYIYGDFSFRPNDLNLKPVNLVENRFIIRELEKEREIMRFFEEAEFKVNSQHIHLDDEEKIFEFLFETVPQLQQLANVFYSDKLKGKKFRPAPKFKGKISLNSDTDLLEVNFELEGVKREEILGILDSLKEKRKFYRLKDGSFLSLASEELTEMAEFIEALDLGKTDLKKKTITLPKYRSLLLDHLALENKSHLFDIDLNFRMLLEDLKNALKTDFEVPSELKATLRDYQVSGFKWLKTIAKHGFGGILADDMGLGKTLQAIAFILSEREKETAPVLVVAPTSVIYNWQAEMEKFAPQLKTVVISGAKNERKTALKEIANFDVIITSYALLRRDIEEYSDKRYSCLFLDEAQYIKNHEALTSKAAKAISAKTVLALTGTPIENSLTELWSIFDCLMPGYMYSYKKFMTRYGKPIEKEADELASKELAKKVSPFILRRLKRDVLHELPEKIEHRLISELTKEQKKLYLAHLERIRKEMSKEIKNNGFAQSKLKILAALTRLRQICCHPGLFIEDYKGESGKLLQLLEVIENALASGHRILIFSQFTEMLKIIGQVLTNEKLEYFYLDGSVHSQKRLEMVHAFNAGEKDLFLISLKAGGTGLNLTGADMVIHFDLWWNPSVEDQASDRAHRMGQKRSVQVMKLISLGTIEEKIYALQQKKKELIDRIVQPGEQVLTSLNEDDIKEILEI